MAKILSRVAPWLSPAGARTGKLRVLADIDTPDVEELVRRDPVSDIFLAAQLETTGSAAPTAGGGSLIGYHEPDDGRLTAVCWSGANIVPTDASAEAATLFGRYLAASGRSFSSIFGPAGAVLPLWSELRSSSPKPFDLRPNQPLLALGGPPDIAPNPRLRFATMADFDALLPACVDMFEEEVGYSPLVGGEDFYRQRVAGFISRRHSLVDRDAEGRVIFKAELGSVCAEASQIQGVWMAPAHRGKGLSVGYLAAVVQLAQEHAPVTSLYVNDYNVRALASYRRVGFKQVGTFATILF